MPNLTITPDPGTGSNRLSLLTPNTITRIQRTDANGTVDLRTLPGQLPYAPALVETRRNLLSNPSFETDAAGWFMARGSVSRYSFAGSANWGNYSPGPSGSYGARLQADGVSGGTYLYSSLVPVTAGQAVAAAVAMSSSPGRWRVSLLWYKADGSGSTINVSNHGAPNPAGESVYFLRRQITSGTAPADATQMRLAVYMLDGSGGTTPAAGDYAYLDRPLLVIGTSIADAEAKAADLFDGDSHKTGTAEGVTAWTGTPHNSVSTYSVAAAPLILDDYEAAGGSATYTVTSTYGDESAAVSLPLAGPWISTPVTPQFSAQVAAVTGYGSGMDSRSTVLEPSGSPYPLVISRATSSRRGNLELWAGTYAAALDLLRLTGRGQVLMLRQSEHPGMDMYFIPTRSGIGTLNTAGAATRFKVDVDYIETARPAGALAGALGWTWGELKNGYASWGAVFGKYATWGDLRTNKRK